MAVLTGQPVANEVRYQDDAALKRFVDAMGGAFQNVAVTICFIIAKDNTPPPYPSPLVNRDRIRQHVSRIEGLAKDGAVLLEAGDMSAVAVWTLPNFQRDPAEIAKLNPLVRQFRDDSMQLKRQFIGTIQTATDSEAQLRPYFCLSFLGRNPDIPKVPGAVSAVIKPMLAKARDDGFPVWLEAADLKVAEVYKHYGFRHAGTILVGVGKYNMQGFPEEGGSGVPCYAMIFDGHVKPEQNGRTN